LPIIFSEQENSSYTDQRNTAITMRFKFDKPTGSQADTKELEYVALLPFSLLGCFALFEKPIMHGRHYNSQTNTVRSSLIEIISSKRYIAALMQTCRPMRQDGSIEGMCKFASLLMMMMIMIMIQ
jgi:hypothetical protein